MTLDVVDMSMIAFTTIVCATVVGAIMYNIGYAMARHRAASNDAGFWTADRTTGKLSWLWTGYSSFIARNYWEPIVIRQFKEDMEREAKRKEQNANHSQFGLNLDELLD